MATTMKGLLKGLRYITQIFDEEKEQEMQIGFPTDVKHVAHIGSDGPATNTPSWMNDFKAQEHEKGQVVSRGNSNKYNPQGMNQRGAGLKELLPPTNNEKPKHKTRRKPSGSASPNPDGSPPRRSSGNAAISSDEQPKQSRHSRSKQGSMDSSNDQEPSVRKRRGGGDKEVSNQLPDGSAPPRKATSRPRKLKGSVGGEASMKKSSKGKPENSVDTCNDNI
ncbi:CRIB domain-containing protein RIC1 [Cardamine amara subsp. amara]|uniref:CRIB domain-containing protein RIC1 n=1 Tax=Cardamine amara subsp. amara TaxID=228776 RepID=A0ABD1AHC1_CARAN